MDFTMLPNERDLVELRNLLVGAAADGEPQSEHRPILITRVDGRNLPQARHFVGAEPRMWQRAVQWHLSRHLEPRT